MLRTIGRCCAGWVSAWTVRGNGLNTAAPTRVHRSTVHGTERERSGTAYCKSALHRRIHAQRVPRALRASLISEHIAPRCVAPRLIREDSHLRTAGGHLRRGATGPERGECCPTVDFRPSSLYQLSWVDYDSIGGVRLPELDCGLFSQIQVPRPWAGESERNAYGENLDQGVAAEQAGFSPFWLTEQHFFAEIGAPPALRCSSPHCRTGREQYGWDSR
jgi:hypothetical protein